MTTNKNNDRGASLAMIAMAVGFAILYPKNIWIEKAGWIWDVPTRNLPTEHMIIAMYITLGAFFVWGARNPKHYVPLINYTIVMSFFHGTVMLYDALRIPEMSNHLGFGGDVIGTYLPLLLIFFHPNRHEWLKAVRAKFKPETVTE